MDGKLRNVRSKGMGLVEFSHKYWRVVPPNTYINETIPIDAGYRSPDIEVTNFCMLPFITSPGYHRSCITEAPTRSMTGEHIHNIDRPCGRRLFMSNHKTVSRYNDSVKEQFGIHRIKDCLDAVDNLTRTCGRPGPKWLASMIIKLYK